MTINYADGKGILLKQKTRPGKGSFGKSKAGGDADQFGRVEDAGWDPDQSTPSVNHHNGVNRKQQMLDVMDQVMQPQAPSRPNAQRPNLNVSGSMYGDE